MIKIVKGNLLDAEESIIAHQVNVHGVMGAGVAYQVAKKYPNVHTAYIEFCIDLDEDYLGGIFYLTENYKTIANMFCQNINADKNGCLTNYGAMRKCFKSLNDNGVDIAIPYGIGCGIARGDWGIVMNIIQEECVDINVTIYKL